MMKRVLWVTYLADFGNIGKWNSSYCWWAKVTSRPLPSNIPSIRHRNILRIWCHHLPSMPFAYEWRQSYFIPVFLNRLLISCVQKRTFMLRASSKLPLLRRVCGRRNQIAFYCFILFLFAIFSSAAIDEGALITDIELKQLYTYVHMHINLIK